jgi:cytochrome b561
MTPQPIAVVAAAPARPPFDRVTIACHWTTLIAVLGLFAAALSIDHAPDPATAKLLLTIHRSLGVTVWALTAFRLGWRLTQASLPPFPATMPQAQRLAAKANEYGLYGLLLLQPLTGLAQTLYRGKAFDLFVWHAPALIGRDKAMVKLFEGVHTAGAVALAALVALHAAAALMHLFVVRDGVFESMAPAARRRPR